MENAFSSASFPSSAASSLIAFPRAPKPLHCLAIKSCPLAFLLWDACNSRRRQLVKNQEDEAENEEAEDDVQSCGLGLEAASWGEVVQATRVGCPPRRIVFDSPCKNSWEIVQALRLGVRINANSLSELEKIETALRAISKSSSIIGLRVNPLVGAGSIASLSTATRGGKFGVTLPPLWTDNLYEEEVDGGGDGSDKREAQRAGVLAERRTVASLFLKYPFLSSLHVHVGSQVRKWYWKSDGLIK